GPFFFFDNRFDSERGSPPLFSAVLSGEAKQSAHNVAIAGVLLLVPLLPVFLRGRERQPSDIAESRPEPASHLSAKNCPAHKPGRNSICRRKPSLHLARENAGSSVSSRRLFDSGRKLEGQKVRRQKQSCIQNAAGS